MAISETKNIQSIRTNTYRIRISSQIILKMKTKIQKMTGQYEIISAKNRIVKGKCAVCSNA